MQVEVKLIPSEDFMALALLYVKMCEHLPENNNAASALNVLTNNLAFYKFMAMGIYEDSNLTGFVTGFGKTQERFHFSGIYVTKWTRNIKPLIQESLDYVKEMGFTSWEADCSNDNILSILNKHGAKTLRTRVKGVY